MKPFKETIEEIMNSIKPEIDLQKATEGKPTFKARLKFDFFTMKEGELIEVQPLEPHNNRNSFLIIYPFCLYPTRRMITAYHLDFVLDD